MDSKDRSIITQVSAKIAAELIPKTDNIEANISAWTLATLDIKEILLQACYPDVPTMVANAFPGSTMSSGSPLNVVGQQHGELPDWLISACKRDGISRIYDNRDGLAQNNKRPWFKAVDDKEKAYWPPKN